MASTLRSYLSIFHPFAWICHNSVTRIFFLSCICRCTSSHRSVGQHNCGGRSPGYAPRIMPSALRASLREVPQLPQSLLRSLR